MDAVLPRERNLREEEQHESELPFGSSDLEVTERRVEVSRVGTQGCGSGEKPGRIWGSSPYAANARRGNR